ncbi:Uncharacterised protein [Vibrio cholerae]|nr:Uncharacterised protein [Vibrio cholerae]
MHTRLQRRWLTSPSDTSITDNGLAQRGSYGCFKEISAYLLVALQSRSPS